MLTFRPKLAQGFSVIEILVALGVLGILALSMVTLTTNLQRQNKDLKQKLEVIELEQGIVRLMSDNAICNCMFQDISMGPNDTSIILSAGLKAGCPPTTGSAANLVQANMKLDSGLKVLSVKLDEIQSIGTNIRTANVVVDFDPNSTTSVIPKSLKIRGQTFKWDGAKLEGCLGIAGQKEMCQGMGGTWTGVNCEWPLPPAASSCAALGGVWANNKCDLQASAPAPASTGAELTCPGFSHTMYCDGISGAGQQGTFTISEGLPYGTEKTVYLADGSCSNNSSTSTEYLCGEMTATCTNGVWQVQSANCTKGND